MKREIGNTVTTLLFCGANEKQDRYKLFAEYFRENIWFHVQQEEEEEVPLLTDEVTDK